MKNILLVLAIILGFAIGLLAGSAMTVNASPAHEAYDNIGVDRFAHFGLSYVINDQLQRTCKMPPFAATLTTIAIGAAKEQWLDDHFDRGDFAADCAGALFYEVKF